jgi:hypothetical protein
MVKLGFKALSDIACLSLFFPDIGVVQRSDQRLTGAQQFC